MGFKEDADFARFVSMGATGAAAVADDLRNHHGHRPIELERYAMANKVWQTKVKRLRLPDLVCARCGCRFESRAKSKLGMVLSHSDQVGREWDAGGMRDDDLFAFLRADLAEYPPRTTKPQYFTAASLRAAISKTKRSAPKAASAGSEVTLTWPSWVPSRAGKLLGEDEQGRLMCVWSDGRASRYSHWNAWGTPRYLLIEVDVPFDADDVMVAGVVAPATDLQCPGDAWDLMHSLKSADKADRYAAVKAVGVLRRHDLVGELEQIASDEQTDWRLCLESLVALARLDPATWTERIGEVALDSECSPEERMEAVFGLSEIATPEASQCLVAVADHSDHPSELRAAACWGLGQGSHADPDALLAFCADNDDLVALHARAAIPGLTESMKATLRGWLDDVDPRRASAAIHLLHRHGCVATLLDATEDGGIAATRARYALGLLGREEVEQQAGERLTRALEEQLAAVWVAAVDWLRGADEHDGLAALDVQKVRYPPAL